MSVRSIAYATFAAVLNAISSTVFAIGTGILIQSRASNNVIEGFFIGTDKNGTTRIPNGDGDAMTSASNLVGGSTVSARNVISGNTQWCDGWRPF